MRWLANYRNCLRLGANQDGLYLAVLFLFRFMHPPLFVPWSEIKITRKRGLFGEYVTLTMGRDAGIPATPQQCIRKPVKRWCGKSLASRGNVIVHAEPP